MSAAPRPPAVLIDCRKLRVGHNGRALLPAIDLQVRAGSCLAIVGRNGAGKTTLLETMLGLIKPIAGSVERSGELRRLCYVPQTNAFDKLLPVRAGEVVMQGRLRDRNFLRPWPSKTDRLAVQTALEEAGATELATTLFRELSVGQRQRVMFARLLVTEAQLAMLDEPTAAMDAVAEKEALDSLLRLARDRSMAIILISHGLDIAERFADQLLLLDRDAGEILCGAREEIVALGSYQRWRRGGRLDAS